MTRVPLVLPWNVDGIGLLPVMVMASGLGHIGIDTSQTTSFLTNKVVVVGSGVGVGVDVEMKIIEVGSLHLFYQVVVHTTLPVNVACSPSAVANCIVTAVPHCPVMVALVGKFLPPHVAGSCESSVPVVVNETF